MSIIPALEIKLLGEFQASSGGAPLSALTGVRLQELLAYLLLYRHAPQPRSRIAFTFWPDSSEANAHLSLRKTLHQLRRLLPDAETRLAIDNSTIQWRLDTPTNLDVAYFEQALSQASSADPTLPEYKLALQDAVQHYGGDLLPGCYAEWVLPERERLGEAFIRALQQLITVHEEQAEYPQAIVHTQRLLRYDPLREESYRLLMRLHAANGDRPAALRVYSRCVTLLERELGIQPGPATRELYNTLLPTSEPQPATVGSNYSIPAQTTPFIGRDRELAEAETLLRRPDVRLVTFTGVGGTGKTRMALEVAADLADAYPDGVFFVPLASVGDEKQVVPAVAQALGLREIAGQPLLDSVITHMRNKRMLLVLDNFEHLLVAANMVAELLARCPQLDVLVTSRSLLRLRGEHEFIVPSLQVPDLEKLPRLEELAACEAVSLFVERALVARSDFALTNQNSRAVAEICARLDGLPLAIELTAARVKILSPQAILSRLAVEGGKLKLLVGGALDLPLRQRALRNAIAWSYDLLDEAEQALFRCLGVFTGGCTLAAVEGVAVPSDLDPLEGLASLVSKSLLRQSESEDGESRFWMLETLREYALERLRECAEMDAVQRRYAEYYLALAEDSISMLAGPNQREWVSRLESEHDNYRAVLRRHIAQGASADAVALSGALWDFWFLHGHLREGMEWIESALALPMPVTDPARARALNSLAAGFTRHGEQSRAQPLLLESLPIWRASNNQSGVARTLNLLGAVAFYDTDYPTACQFYTESLEAWRKLDEPWLTGNVLANLGLTFLHMEDFDRAEDFFNESMTLQRSIGDQDVKIVALANLGFVLLHRGDYARATVLCQEFLDNNRLTGDRRNMAHGLLALGLVAMEQGDLDAAEAHYKEGLLVAREISNHPYMVRMVTGFARLAAERHQGARAGRLYGFVAAQSSLITVTMNPEEKRTYTTIVQDVSQNMDSAEWSAAEAEGHAMTFEQGIAYALSDS
jgi:predicted ATPase/DNA-binding SARP family transcriptional activator